MTETKTFCLEDETEGTFSLKETKKSQAFYQGEMKEERLSDRNVKYIEYNFKHE